MYTMSTETGFGESGDVETLKLMDSPYILNDNQVKALKLSVKNKFQLIQGPPG